MAVAPPSTPVLSPARRAAARVLSRVWDDGAFAHEALSAVLQQTKLTDIERSEATRLAYGAIAYTSTLEYMLAHFFTKLSGIKPRVRTALKLSLYELYFTPVKDYAIVSQGVELVKELHSYSAGVANAMLRTALKERESFPWDESLTALEKEALRQGFPLWIGKKFAREFGEEQAKEIMEASSLPAPLYGFVPPAAAGKLTDSGLEFEWIDPTALPHSIRFCQPSLAVNHELVNSRTLLIVDAVAQYVASLYVSNFDPNSAEFTAVEIGSGRGTKTVIGTFLLREAVRTNQKVWLHAIDSHEFKSSITRDYAQAHQLTEIIAHTLDATNADAIRAALSGSLADTLLIDAPCTGLGTLRRHPDKRAKLTPSDVSELATLSGELLVASADVVKPGGQIIYATCTMTSEENAEVVSSFLDSRQGQEWELVPFTAADVPAAWRGFVTEKGFFQSFPTKDGPDGHFIARLVKSLPTD